MNCSELSIERALLGLPHIVKAASETRLNPRLKVNSTLEWSLTRVLLRDGRYAKREFWALQY